MLLLLDLCLRVPPPGHSVPISSSRTSYLDGMDVVSAVAEVLNDGLYPMLSQLAANYTTAASDIMKSNDELGDGNLDWCLGCSCTAKWPKIGPPTQGQTMLGEVCASYALLHHNKRGQLGEVGRELLTSSHVIANLDAAVYYPQQQQQQQPPPPNQWLPEGR